MKKILGIAAILTLGAGLAFGQNEGADTQKPTLKFGGSVKTGIRVQDKNVDYFSDDIGDDSGNHDGRALRVDLNGLYDAGNYGVKFGLRTDLNKKAPSASFSADMYEGLGFVTFFDKKATIKVGKIFSPIWNSAGLKNRNLVAGALGLRLEITPISGLNFGALFGGRYDIGINSVTETAHTEKSIVDYLKETVVGASYKTGKFYVSTSYAPTGRPKGVNINAPIAAGGFAQNYVDNQFIFGIGFSAVENLDFAAEFLFADGFDEYGDESNYANEINQDITYQLGRLNIGVEVYEYPVTVFNMDITPKATCNITDNLSCDIFVPIRNLCDGDLGLAVKPGLSWEFGKNSRLVVYDEIAVTPEVRNVFQVDFVFSF